MGHGENIYTLVWHSAKNAIGNDYIRLRIEESATPDLRSELLERPGGRLRILLLLPETLICARAEPVASSTALDSALATESVSWHDASRTYLQ